MSNIKGDEESTRSRRGERKMRMRWPPRMGWLLVIALSGVAVAATAGPMNGHPLPQEIKMSVEDVVRMIKAGVSEDLVIARIKHNGNAFHLTAEEIVELKRAQV